MENLPEIKDRLKWIRMKRRFKHAVDAAAAFGWKQPTYLGHENGDRKPGRETAEKYAKAFRVPLGWLLNGEGGLPKIDGAQDRLVAAVEKVRSMNPAVQEEAANTLESLIRTFSAGSGVEASPVQLDSQDNPRMPPTGEERGIAPLALAAAGPQSPRPQKLKGAAPSEPASGRSSPTPKSPHAQAKNRA